MFIYNSICSFLDLFSSEYGLCLQKHPLNLDEKQKLNLTFRESHVDDIKTTFYSVKISYQLRLLQVNVIES